MIDFSRLIIRETEAGIHESGGKPDSLRKIEDVLVKEWHLDVGLGIVEIDSIL